MYQFSCDCNERCFMITKTVNSNSSNSNSSNSNSSNSNSSNSNSSTTLQKKCVYKCNRLKSDKKKPCSYYKEMIIEEKPCENMPISKIYKSTNNTELLTINDYKIKINRLLEYYNSSGSLPSTNYFGKLNHYLKIIGHSVHIPTIESLDELKLRLSKKSIKDVIKIYINKENSLSQNFREFDYNREKEEEIYNNIKNKVDPFKWKKIAIEENTVAGPYANYSTNSLLKLKTKKIKKKSTDERFDPSSRWGRVYVTKELVENSDNEDSDEEAEEETKEHQFDIEEDSDEYQNNDNNDADFSD